MQHPSLETIAECLSEQLRCEQEDLCRPIVQQVTRGKPVAPAALRASLQVSQDELEQRLAKLPPDVELDQAGNIVGLGATLVPTSHRFQMGGRLLYTWCAFDTVLFPPSLQASAEIQSTCPITGYLITFVATPEGVIKDLTPASAVISLIVPGERSECVRSTFCQQSLFFQSEQAATTWLVAHPEALLLSVEEAARVGKLVAESRFTTQQT